VKLADGWRIKVSTYQRLYEIQEQIESAPKLTAHYLADAAARRALAGARTGAKFGSEPNLLGAAR
jgi:hypothetical protein